MSHIPGRQNQSSPILFINKENLQVTPLISLTSGQINMLSRSVAFFNTAKARNAFQNFTYFFWDDMMFSVQLLHNIV